jgi:hypothetical protein
MALAPKSDAAQEADISSVVTANRAKVVKLADYARKPPQKFPVAGGEPTGLMFVSDEMMGKALKYADDLLTDERMRRVVAQEIANRDGRNFVRELFATQRIVELMLEEQYMAKVERGHNFFVGIATYSTVTPRERLTLVSRVRNDTTDGTSHLEGYVRNHHGVTIATISEQVKLKY